MFYMFTNRDIDVPVEYTNGRSKVGSIGYYKSRVKKNKANTNQINFPTMNASIALKTQQHDRRWKNTVDVERT